jgi:hypothetical protein
MEKEENIPKKKKKKRSAKGCKVSCWPLPVWEEVCLTAAVLFLSRCLGSGLQEDLLV